MRGLADKVALVTGAGGGIGAAICKRLAEEGCHVALFDRDAEPTFLRPDFQNLDAQAVGQASDD